MIRNQNLNQIIKLINSLQMLLQMVICIIRCVSVYNNSECDCNVNINGFHTRVLCFLRCAVGGRLRRESDSER
jgi:hypothetical protein